jgi:hypothetical protein
VKSANKVELEGLLCGSLGFPAAAFMPKPKEKLAQFAIALLQELESDLTSFLSLSAAEQKAAAALSSFPPPNGAQLFFKATVTRVSVLVSCACSVDESRVHFTQGTVDAKAEANSDADSEMETEAEAKKRAPQRQFPQPAAATAAANSGSGSSSRAAAPASGKDAKVESGADSASDAGGRGKVR